MIHKNHNLFDIYTISIFLFMINFYLCFVFEEHFHLINYQIIACFHIFSLMHFLHTILIYYLHNFKKSHKFVKFMICEIRQIMGWEK
jgi:hypothetical protein